MATEVLFFGFSLLTLKTAQFHRKEAAKSSVKDMFLHIHTHDVCLVFLISHADIEQQRLTRSPLFFLPLSHSDKDTLTCPVECLGLRLT